MVTRTCIGSRVRCPFHARDRKKSLAIDISEIRRNIVWLGLTIAQMLQQRPHFKMKSR
ncbi:hypothetical protein CLOBOL_01308 [Enterocloster bolteae ATCC BAA-613]|uniref:Uncharacterized protein n=1 Tax=Enterocloster bolteae (strain ATCC BAA-613 / DSM 15670 / CCUG 46953 / JCM 12243 / WAL 16351) TaxID=411902 RepID=A8RKG4_ENTBW|nr:hypothetical protein CLOBOL_01308 [Enterocloster bolteae ATCC BAA-613]